ELNSQIAALSEQYGGITDKQSEDAKKIAKELDRLRGELKKLDDSIPVTMIMRDRDEPRETYRLVRGQWDQPDKSQLLSPGVPACLPPLPDDAPPNRLGLARWLVDPGNPLTARVAVNRAWQHFFGKGLVATPEDFGAQGERPSHPELLDWLACEFAGNAECGTRRAELENTPPSDTPHSEFRTPHSWSLKRLHRLIVTSASYRQSAEFGVRSAELQNARPSSIPQSAIPNPHSPDPDNRLLARGPRLRLSSQAIRDQALAVSGLLVERIGGPPVKPYQPAGVWSDLTLGKIKYEQDHGAGLYRRGLYTFWRRSVGPTVFFDSASRQVCTVRQARTNTPLHALTLMNDVTYIEAARQLAERAMTEAGPSTEECISHMFRLATLRRPTDAEMHTLLDLYQRVHQRYENDPEAAKQLLSVGESPRNESLDLTGHAAHTGIANVILNLDEVMTKE
ncbi:MAG: DUF1553 domain-containing protein, partial [Planctomycetaceae bacterium]